MFIKFQSNNNPLLALVGLVVSFALLYLFITALGWVLYGLYAFGWLLIPLILWVNAKVLGIYLEGILAKWRSGIVVGLIATVTMLAFYPFILLYILATGFLQKKIQQQTSFFDQASQQKHREPEYTEYEEISSIKMEDKNTLNN